jgi:MFS family permease
MSLMNNGQQIEENEGIQSPKLIKRLWPHFLIYNSYAFTLSMLFINIIIIANIIWSIPDAFAEHAMELGILTGTSFLIIAISGILFGVLADKKSRVRLMAYVELLYGIGLVLNAFVPEGQGQVTYFYFLFFSLVRGFAIGGMWPLITSHINDLTEEKERSNTFGILQGLFQFFQMIGMVISALFFQFNFWRQFFIFTGMVALIFGAIILFKGKEPKRGAMRKELKETLTNNDLVYDYKLTKKTIRTTIFAPTNLIAFFEGFFTNILLGVPNFLMSAYLLSPPFNFSPLIIAFYTICFGLPGGMIGALAFAKISDRLGTKNIKNRVYMIVISIVMLSICFMSIFFLPLPHFTPEQGNNLILMFSHPIFWLLGIFMAIAFSFVGLWNINQPPILQEINLPEAQGKMNSANQFLEYLGMGIGPIIAGLILSLFNQNFQTTILITMILGIIGGFIWLLATIWINKDVEKISTILEQRKEEITIQAKEVLI